MSMIITSRSIIEEYVLPISLFAIMHACCAGIFANNIDLPYYTGSILTYHWKIQVTFLLKVMHVDFILTSAVLIRRNMYDEA